MVPTEVFPASQLPWHLQTSAHTGRRRKVPIEELDKCPRKIMTQWKCEPEGETIRCWPVERFFRVCKDVTVEVTEFERAVAGMA
jgi:hypothetical protein